MNENEIIMPSELPTIGLDEITTEIENLISESPSIVNQEGADVLDEILNFIEPVNFYEEANLEENQKIDNKVRIVTTVGLTRKIADDLGFGLCQMSNIPYCFNGAYWQTIEEQRLAKFLGKASFRLGIDYVTSTYHKFRDELVKQFIADGYKHYQSNSEDKVLINLQNGTFEFSTEGRELRPFNKEDFLTYQLPFSFDPNAQCPKWIQFLNRVLPDPASQQTLAEYLAYPFTNLKLEKVLILIGIGANGKSVVFAITTALYGPENISHYDLKELCGEYYRAALANKLLNYSSEMTTKVESQLFKKLASGEPISARSPYSKPFLMYKYGKLAFNCNELPKEVEHTEAYFRRFLIIPFQAVIPEDERNPELANEIINEELSGVFNWVLNGLESLLTKKKFTESDLIKSAIKQYRHETDSVALFLEEFPYEKISEQNRATRLKEIYQDYRQFCIENGFRAVSSGTLRKRLIALGFESARTKVGQVMFMAREKSY